MINQSGDDRVVMYERRSSGQEEHGQVVKARVTVLLNVTRAATAIFVPLVGD